MAVRRKLRLVAGALLLLQGGAAAREAEADLKLRRQRRLELIERVKAELHTLTPDEAARKLGGIEVLPQAPPKQNKIEHFVVLFMENHAFDTMLGCMDLPGIDGIPKEGHQVPRVPGMPWLGHVNISCGNAPYVCGKGPTYSPFSGKFFWLANMYKYPYSSQSDKWSFMNGATGEAVRLFSKEQLPVKYALAKEFGVFNKLYAAVPSMSSPNHMFTQSGTSCGTHDNILYTKCGGKQVSFPQFTMYDSMALDNVSFAFYMNSTCGIDGKPCHGEDPSDPDSMSAISTPDVGMDGVRRYQPHFYSQELFYKQAAEGTLPAFSWINPPIEACDHPCHDVAKGERFLKDVYEALRAGPGWEKTMLFVAYDDAGGFYDHVVPPQEGVPADEAPCTLRHWCNAGSLPFDFRRLGLRITAMLISPWVAKGAVFQEPQLGPQKTSQFELTSVAATVKDIFNLSTHLTKRDAWAGSFYELLLDAPRKDTPTHLPEAPPPAEPWGPVPGEAEQESGGLGSWLFGRRLRSLRDALLGTEAPRPQHCAASDGVCRGRQAVTAKQRRQIELFAALTGTEAPKGDLSHGEANLWLRQRWAELLARGPPGTDRQGEL